jgi:hypothetical protein
MRSRRGFEKPPVLIGLPFLGRGELIEVMVFMITTNQGGSAGQTKGLRQGDDTDGTYGTHGTYGAVT